MGTSVLKSTILNNGAAFEYPSPCRMRLAAMQEGGPSLLVLLIFQEENLVQWFPWFEGIKSNNYSINPALDENLSFLSIYTFF